MVRTSDGGAEILAWDWEAKDFVGGTVGDFDALMEYESPGGGADALKGDVPLLGGADVRTVSDAEFKAHVAKMKKP